jgi:indole-3-glycerol phosphate synthase
VQIIAEVKTHSPFDWQSSHSWEELFEVANRVGDIISIHTDPRWHGSFELVSKARRLTHKPILAKGIHAEDNDILKALAAGADYALVVGRIPDVHFEQCFVEPNSLDELQELPANTKAVWNSRDLLTGGTKAATFAEARAVFPGWLCQASNIVSVEDIDRSADAILVGTHLMELAQQLKPDS